jgi:NDP-mannose synthase
MKLASRSHSLDGGGPLSPSEDGSVEQAVILCGGAGTRLAPYTHVLPKPLLPVGDRAILEHVIEHLSLHGFKNITLSVGYLAHLIQAVFGDGDSHGVGISYVHEDRPLGTAGSLRLIEGLDSTFLMLNGDVLTTLDYRELIHCHYQSRNLLTIAVNVRTTSIDYGVLTLGTAGRGGRRRVTRYDEKPTFDATVSMGIYVLEPAVLEYIPANDYFDFPQLVQALLEAGARVGVYVFGGFWLDIGRHEDYQVADDLWTAGKLEATVARPVTSI